MPKSKDTSEQQASTDSRDSFVGAIAELEALLAAGPTNKPWTDSEAAVLDRYYGRVNASAIAKSLGRTLGSVRCKANEMGLMLSGRRAT